MSYPDRESYTFLQVDRPILGGAEEFLVRAGEIGKLTIGSVTTTTLSESYISEENFSEKSHFNTKIRPLQQSRTDIFRPGELNMVLLRRVAPGEMSNTYNLNAKAAAYHTKRQSNLKIVNGSKRIPSRSIIEQIDEIGIYHDLNPKETPVICDRIQDIFDPIFGPAMALVPKAGQTSTWVLGQQANKALISARTISPRKLAFSNNPWTPMVPFMSLPTDLEAPDYAHFCDKINELLESPIRLIMGGVAAYSGSATGNKYVDIYC